MHSCVAQGLCLWVHHCTAVQLMVKGRRRRSERRKERRWRSSRASPASLGTCPGRQLQLLLWGKVSSAWLPLASPECLPSVLAFILKPSVWLGLLLFLFLSALFFFLWKLQAIWLWSSNWRAPLFCPLWVVSSVFTPPNGKSGRLSGVNMWALPGLKYHPPPW